MAELWALLPGVQGRQIQQALTTAGTADSVPVMPGPWTNAGPTPWSTCSSDGPEPAEVSLQVIVGADTLTGTSQEPGWVPGLGPVTTTEVQELVGTGRTIQGPAGPREGPAVADRPGHRDPDRPDR